MHGEPFTLDTNYRPKRQKVKGENNPNNRQAVLFAGMDCLPGTTARPSAPTTSPTISRTTMFTGVPPRRAGPVSGPAVRGVLPVRGHEEPRGRGSSPGWSSRATRTGAYRAPKPTRRCSVSAIST